MNLLVGFFEHWDNVHEITMRLLKQIPEDQLNFKPTPKNFTTGELIMHLFHVEEVFAETGKAGEFKWTDFNEIPQPTAKSVSDLIHYANRVHDKTNEYFAGLTEEELIKTVRTPWGDQPLFVHLNGAYEEHWHHRGQLYIYLRMMGVSKLTFVYDYDRKAYKDKH